MKLPKLNYSKQILCCLCLFLFASCSKAEGAKAEAFFLNMFSLFGLSCMLSVVGLSIVFATLSKGSEYHSMFKILSYLGVFGGAIILVYWTLILTTDWVHSDAYLYGEGVFFVLFSYLCACIIFVLGIVYVRRAVNNKL